MSKPVIKLNTQNLELNRVQDNFDNATRKILKDPILDSVDLFDVELTLGVNKIKHTLGRKPIGFLDIGKVSGGDYYMDKPNTNEKIIFLLASNDMTVNIRVY